MTYTIIKTKDGAAVVEWIEKPCFMDYPQLSDYLNVRAAWETDLMNQPNQIPVHPKDVQYFLDNWLYKEMPEGVWKLARIQYQQHAIRKEQPQEGDVVEKPVLIGFLNKEWGLNGYNKALVGHPVYELKDRYLIILTGSDKPDITVPFYKETLHNAITFNTKTTQQ